ncbi:hypothetical protein G9X64_15260 [Rhizobium sophorae]|uniref:Uncharacterized protein n=1 Tax=Rhizobium sophorae TaxID=1535242 RepID=A0A7Y3WEQ0_9HYPH|nr:hypothetical protein [Rhizobium sophorae]NNU37825.1 hypothetical protein [Rhizobium sophorae]
MSGSAELGAPQQNRRYPDIEIRRDDRAPACRRPGFRRLMINVDAHCINLDCREILTDLPP